MEANARPRLAPVPEPSEDARALLQRTLLRDGRPLDIFRTLAWHPGLLKQFNRLGGFLLTRGLLPARERELVILRVGWCCRSEYEFGQHTLIGRETGLTDEEILRLIRPGHEGWGEGDRPLVAMVDELCRDDRVGDATWAELARRWNEAELVELLVLAGFYRLVAGFLNSAGVRREEGTPGWPDAAVRPSPTPPRRPTGLGWPA